VKKLFSRVNKEDKHLFIDFIAMLSRNSSVKVEDTIMDILQKEKKISKEHYSQLLRFLMNSTNSSTIEKLIKMYG
jgi:hypothetical protein